MERHICHACFLSADPSCWAHRLSALVILCEGQEILLAFILKSSSKRWDTPWTAEENSTEKSLMVWEERGRVINTTKEHGSQAHARSPGKVVEKHPEPVHLGPGHSPIRTCRGQEQLPSKLDFRSLLDVRR